MRYTQDEVESEIATAAVIIATGGFAGNPGLLRKYCPSYSDDLVLSGLPLTGDGLLLAEKAGAALADFATVLKEGPRLAPRQWPLGHLERDPSTLWVNKCGKRFIDETAGYHVFESVNAMLAQPDGVSFALFDAHIKDIFKKTMPEIDAMIEGEMEKQRVYRAASWEDTAGWIGCSPAVLLETVARYNSLCARGYDEDMGKNRRYLLPLIFPPYYAIKGIPVILDTIGGVIINENMEVLNPARQVIPGLYAAGVVTSGWQSEVYCSELSASAFGFAINSGRIAGENAARFIHGERI